MGRRIRYDELKAAWWALRAVRAYSRQLRERGLRNLALPSATHIPSTSERGVHAILRRLRCTCLTQAYVLQAWHVDHGEALDVVIGVRSPAEGFSAHAWLAESTMLGADTGHAVLCRVPPPPRR